MRRFCSRGGDRSIILGGEQRVDDQFPPLPTDADPAWTVHGRGKIAEDLLDALARHRLDVRENVVTRVDLSPRDQVEQWRGSPMGVLWQGRGTVRRRIGPGTPVPGVYAAGAHTAPGAGVPFVTQSAGLVAQLIGPS